MTDELVEKVARAVYFHGEKPTNEGLLRWVRQKPYKSSIYYETAELIIPIIAEEIMKGLEKIFRMERYNPIRWEVAWQAFWKDYGIKVHKE